MTKTMLQYWEDYMNDSHPLIEEWFKKEDYYLKKNIKKKSIILDVGCGFGRNIKLLANDAKKVIGIDNDKKLEKLIKKELSKIENVEFILQDVNNLSFSKNSFDYVLCTGNIFGSFAQDKISILRKMKKVCSQDGKIFISVYSENALSVRIKQYEKIGVTILKVENGTVYTKNNLILEQFTKKQLKDICDSVKLKSKIIKLNAISYLCIATK